MATKPFKIIVDLYCEKDDSLRTTIIWSDDLAEYMMQWKEEGWHVNQIQRA